MEEKEKGIGISEKGGDGQSRERKGREGRKR